MMAGDPDAPAMASSSSSGSAMDEALEDIISSFQCPVCLDLLYKPVVLACGHIACFWCVHEAMHNFQTSHCILCRQPYNHFPSICHLLHHLLLKIAPLDYARRQKEVLEEERYKDMFSPQFLDDSLSQTVHSGNLEEVETSAGDLKNNTDIDSDESCLDENCIVDGVVKQASVYDVLCGLCKELLFEPAVLNCGHVYCGSCLSSLTARPLKCEICQCIHPGEFPSVCLDLDHFLEEKFPREYRARKCKVFLEEVHHQCASQNEVHKSESSSHAKEKIKPSEVLPDAHWGIGCDSCGMYPLTGKRYRCKDCKERVGFDLCEVCYSTSSKLPGRFNQQHTPNHEFEIDDSMLLLRFGSLSLEDDYSESDEE